MFFSKNKNIFLFKILLFFLLAFYILELIFNRTLMRVLIFIPPGKIQELLSVFTSVGGLIFLNITVVFSIMLLLLLVFQKKLVPILIIISYVLDLLGIVKIKWIIPILALYFVAKNPKRILESIILLLVLYNTIYPSAIVAYVTLLVWTFLPLAYTNKKNIKKTIMIIPIAILLLFAIYKNPYITGQVFMLSMGVNNPWFLPIAIIIYSISYSPSRITLFLTGLQFQLSNQVLVISSAYLTELFLGKENIGNSEFSNIKNHFIRINKKGRLIIPRLHSSLGLVRNS